MVKFQWKTWIHTKKTLNANYNIIKKKKSKEITFLLEEFSVYTK